MSSLFGDLQSRAKEELASAWQTVVAEATPALERILGERFRDISQLHDKEVARTERILCERLNQTARRLQRAEDLAEWKATLVEAARSFASIAAVLPKEATWQTIPAFATVLETRDTVVTVKAADQLSPAVLAQAGESTATRCYLIPIFGDTEIGAILYAEPGKNFDRNALELLGAMAWGTMPESPAVAPPHGLVEVAGMTAASARRSVPQADLPRHLAAQRFARVRVAELVLHNRRLVETGRAQRRLYLHLKDAIDANRREFRARFVDSCASMADYFHEELVHTLAHDDAETMGSEYPGAVV